jgi:hypothetical protein
MDKQRCVAVHLGWIPLTSIGEAANLIIDRNGLGWDYGEMLEGGTGYIVHRDFESDAGFDAALKELRKVVGDEHAEEVPCRSQYDG